MIILITDFDCDISRMIKNILLEKKIVFLEYNECMPEAEKFIKLVNCDKKIPIIIDMDNVDENKQIIYNNYSGNDALIFAINLEKKNEL